MIPRPISPADSSVAASLGNEGRCATDTYTDQPSIDERKSHAIEMLCRVLQKLDPLAAAVVESVETALLLRKPHPERPSQNHSHYKDHG